MVKDWQAGHEKGRKHTGTAALLGLALAVVGRFAPRVVGRLAPRVLEHTNTDVDRLGRGGVDVDALAQHVCLHGEGDGGGELGFEFLPCIVFVVVGLEVHDNETACAVYGCGMVRSREEQGGVVWREGAVAQRGTEGRAV